MIKKLLLTLVAIIALAGIYTGSYLPLAKGQRYIRASATSREAKTLGNFIETFDSVFEYHAPVVGDTVSEIELIKFFGGDILGTINNGEQSEDTSRKLAEYIEEHSNKEEFLQVFNLATTYQALWRRYDLDGEKNPNESEYYNRSLKYFEKALSIGPNVPQPLYNLFDMYRAGNDFDKAREVGNTILENWGDSRITDAINQFPQ
jgi:tetratricopeptide (TPR) repeat protein